jgi:hypothetical protein
VNKRDGDGQNSVKEVNDERDFATSLNYCLCDRKGSPDIYMMDIGPYGMKSEATMLDVVSTETVAGLGINVSNTCTVALWSTLESGTNTAESGCDFNYPGSSAGDPHPGLRRYYVWHVEGPFNYRRSCGWSRRWWNLVWSMRMKPGDSV